MAAEGEVAASELEEKEYGTREDSVRWWWRRCGGVAVL